MIVIAAHHLDYITSYSVCINVHTIEIFSVRRKKTDELLAAKVEIKSTKVESSSLTQL